jgi:hypothetical protein
MRWTWILISLLAGLALACTCDARAWDYVASRRTTITSERPISVLALEAMAGVLYGPSGAGPLVETGKVQVETLQTTLRIDGQPVARLGILPSLRRIAGFVLWDEAGRIERTTTATVRGHSVRVVDTVTNGRVRVRVVIGPPLGDKRVKCAVLTLEVADDGHAFRRVVAETRIWLSCSAHIDLPGDRCRLVRRIAVRAAEREAGPELSKRVGRLKDAGRAAVQRGRAQIPEIVTNFIYTVTSQER